MFPMLERRRIFHLRSTMADSTLRPYPTKVLLAWAEAISMRSSGLAHELEYPELGVLPPWQATSRAWIARWPPCADRPARGH